ncbi:MAG: hypothetical protein CMF59_09605 [Leptospiraceae bacterium]|nr:hypothetical protein [Leptospiraceae bacterium]|tara:strand:- start:271 stop:669 length:399 start_codon:yes stop_codon:yes gene_type:complete
MILSILALIIVLITILFFLWPIMQPVQDGAHYFVSGKSRRQDLLDEKSVLIANLQDLRIEAESGKIPDEELKRLSAPLLRNLDKVEGLLKNYPDSEIRGKNQRFCPACGHLRHSQSESHCLQCGLSYEETGS